MCMYTTKTGLMSEYIIIIINMLYTSNVLKIHNPVETMSKDLQSFHESVDSSD